MSLGWQSSRHNATRDSFANYPADIGSLLWTFTPGAGIYLCAPPVISAGGLIYAVGADATLYHVYQLSAVDGSVVWHVSGPKLASSPQDPECLADDALMIGLREHVYCFNAGNGSIRWDFNPASGGGGNPPSQLLSGDLAVQYSSFGPTTTHLDTLSTLDASAVTSNTVTPVAVNTVGITTDGADVYFQQVIGGVAKLRRYTATGAAVVWTAALTATDSFLNEPTVISGNYVLVHARVGSSASLTLFCLNLTTGAIIWSAASAWGSGFYGRDLGLCPSTDGVLAYHQLAEIDNGDGTYTETLEARNLATGAVVWTHQAIVQDINDNHSSVPVIGTNGQILWGINGMQCLAASDGHLIRSISRATLAGTNPDTTLNCFTFPPAVGNNYILVMGGGTGQNTFGIGSRPSIFAYGVVPSGPPPGLPPPIETIPTPPGVVTECVPEGPVLAGSNVDVTKPSAVGWYYDNRYHLSVGGRTVAIDLLNPIYGPGSDGPAWTDIGYGLVSAAVIASVEGFPEDCLLVMRNEFTDPASPYWPRRGNMVRHTHRMLNLESPNTHAPFEKRFKIGPFDGLGPDRERYKWAHRLIVWGDYELPMDDNAETPIIGEVTLTADGSYSETYPIWPLKFADFEFENSPRVYDPGELFRQEFSPGMVGKVLEAEVVMFVDCCHVFQAMMEYSRRT